MNKRTVTGQPDKATDFALLLREFEELAQGYSQSAALAYMRSTMAPELVDAAFERYLAWDREYSHGRIGKRLSATSSR